MTFYPYKKGVAGKVLAMLKGRRTKGFEVVLTQEREDLAILMRGAKSLHPFKGRQEKFYPVLRGDANSFGLTIFPFCSPPSP